MLGTARFLENEIAKSEDFNYNNQKMIENLDTILSGSFGMTNFIFFGFDVAEISPASMNVSIAPGFGLTTEGLIQLQASITPVPVSAADGSFQRIDTVEIRRVETTFDKQQRAFKDPVSKAVWYQDVDTKTRWEIEVNIIAGTPGAASASEHTPGWLKIAEITVPAGATLITDANIKNVGNTFYGLTVPGWTNETMSTWAFGSLADFLVAFRQNHDISGEYKNVTIKTRHVDWGTNESQINASDIPIIDTSGVIDASNVEAALTETKALLNTTVERIVSGGVMGNSELVVPTENRIWSSIKPGTIWMYDGTNWQDNITMPGWYACVPSNAGHGCPNLVDRFVMGRDIAGGGATGGANSYRLTTNQLPSHTHSINHNHGSHNHSINHDHGAVTSGSCSVDHTHYVSGTTSHKILQGGVSHSGQHDNIGLFVSRTGIFTLSGLKGEREAGGTGGNAYRTLNVNASHDHTWSSTSNGQSANHTHTVDLPNYTGNSGTTSISFTGNSGTTGNGHAVDNRPAFYSIIFIRKCA